jgi:two-component system chemotaxis response regulator CheB
MLRILVADDSALAREALMEVINDDTEMMVAGAATSGRETVRKAADLRPDLVTMDLLMPDMDGVEATRQIMAQRPVPIVLVSSTVGAILGTTHFDALSAGAVDVMEKPDFTQLRTDVSFRQRFLDALKGMSQVVTVTRRERRGLSSSAPPHPKEEAELSLVRKPERSPHGARLIVVGASTGGPPAIARTLSLLNGRSAPPVVLVQHMASGFIGGFAEWLDRQIAPAVRVASNGERLAAGNVYVAPDDHHVEVTAFGRLLVCKAAPLRYHRPSVDVLFDSAATCYGKQAIGVLLTGMGDDGARGLERMRSCGAFTIGQDEPSSAVFGMPGAAAQRGAVMWSADCASIAAALEGIKMIAQEEGTQ